MDDIEALLNTIRTFYAKLEQLRAMEGPEFVLPGRIETYRETLEDAYAAYGRLETTVDELGAELEYQQGLWQISMVPIKTGTGSHDVRSKRVPTISVLMVKGDVCLTP